MYSSICYALFIIGLFSFNVSAQQACTATKYTHKQCLFDIPDMKDGIEQTSTFSKFGLIGGVISKCENGTVSFGAAICKPTDKTSCSIPETVWGEGEGGYCQHSLLPGTLADGQTKIALSETDSQGRIVYSCDNGNLTQETSFCSGLSGQSDAKVSGQAVDNMVFGVRYETCDSAWVFGKTTSRDIDKVEIRLCNASGFTTLDKIYSAEPYPVRPPDSEALYHIEAMCSGNTNTETSCQTPPSENGRTDDFIQTLDCDKASIAGLVNSPNGFAPTTTTVESALCASNGYSTLNSLEGLEWIDPTEDTSDGTSYYAEVVCSGNSNSESMCQADNNTRLNVLDCDSAAVSGDVDGIYKVSETRPPSEAQVQAELCVVNGYASLREVTGYIYSPSGLRGVYEVSAICEDNSNPTQNCRNSCMGQLVTDDSSLPKIQGSDGRFYLDTCVDTPVVPTGFCEDCENADINFFDAKTGNTCTLYDQNVLTGEQKDIDFARSDFNGTVNVSCNSSQTSVLSGECYKTCKGGSRAVWRDNNGANSCGSQIPAGDYYQDETVLLGTDINNGSAVFRCDDGAWVQEGTSQCLLDCDGTFNWGSGVSANGVNKNGICRADVGLVKHGATTTSPLPSTTPFTDGESDASCNDGVITPRNSRCELGCRTETGYWGAGRCSNTIPNTDNNDIARVDTPTPLTGYSGTAFFACGDGDFTLGSSNCYQDCPSKTLNMNACSYKADAAKHDARAPYTLSTSSTEADVSYTCRDGNWTRDSGSYCSTGKLEYGTWSGWVNQGGGYSYSGWSPAVSNYYADERFTQTRTFSQNQSRSRSVHMVFPPSSRRDFVRNETGARTITNSMSRVATGTKVRSSLVWVSTGIIHYEEPMVYGSDKYIRQQNPGCTGPERETANTPEVNLGDACSTKGEEAYHAFSCQFEDGYCTEQGGNNSQCGGYFGEGEVAVCASGNVGGSGGSTVPNTGQSLAECARVDVEVSGSQNNHSETGVANTSTCDGLVSVSIDVTDTKSSNLAPDGSCGFGQTSTTVYPNMVLPQNTAVNTYYSCNITAEFTFTRGTETHKISKKLQDESVESCQVDTGSDRC